MSLAEPVAHQQMQSLYSSHHHWLQGWLRRQLGNAYDAADLAQDVFMRLLARQSTVDMLQPRAYLSTIARALVIEHWRRRELEQAWLATLAQLPEQQAPSPETRLLFLETLVEIDRLLDRLKPQVRSAFLWAQLEGLTCRQIAERSGKSVATIERYLATALRHCYAVRFGTQP